MAPRILKSGDAHETAAMSPSNSAIYHCIRYTIDPQKAADFETYARRWMEGGIIKRCGGEPLGYFLPKKGYGGPDNVAYTFIGFDSLAAYEEYRKKLVADPEAKANVEFARKSGCILSEDRSYVYRIAGNGK
jgi:NIPSNAP